MLRRNYLRSICRPAIRSDSKVPSCGTQPAHFSVDTRRHDTLDTLRGLIRSLHPTHLTKSVPYQTSQGRKVSSRRRHAVCPGGVFVVGLVVA